MDCGCGEGEIRTRDRLAPILVFKTSALGHYATPPINFPTKMRRVPESDWRNRSFADSRVSTSPTRPCVQKYILLDWKGNSKWEKLPEEGLFADSTLDDIGISAVILAGIHAVSFDPYVRDLESYEVERERHFMATGLLKKRKSGK